MKASEGAATRAFASTDAAGVPSSSKEQSLEVGSDAAAAGARGAGQAAPGESANRAQAASEGEGTPEAAGWGADSAQNDGSAQAPDDAAQQPAISTPKEGAVLFRAPCACDCLPLLPALGPDPVRVRGAEVAAPVATPQTAAPTGNIFARKSSQGIVTGPRSCAFCSRTFISQHALDIHLSRNMVPRFDARACSCAVPVCLQRARVALVTLRLAC